MVLSQVYLQSTCRLFVYLIATLTLASKATYPQVQTPFWPFEPNRECYPLVHLFFRAAHRHLRHQHPRTSTFRPSLSRSTPAVRCFPSRKSTSCLPACGTDTCDFLRRVSFCHFFPSSCYSPLQNDRPILKKIEPLFFVYTMTGKQRFLA